MFRIIYLINDDFSFSNSNSSIYIFTLLDSKSCTDYFTIYDLLIRLRCQKFKNSILHTLVILISILSIKVLIFFCVFSPFLGILLLKRYLIKLIGLLGPIDLWTLLEFFFETFNGPWGLWDALIEYLQDVELLQDNM